MKTQFCTVAFVYTLLHVVQSGSEAGASIPTEVGRRQMKDFFVPLNSRISTNCDSVNNTYLVSQRTCVNNEELFSMCSSVVIPTKLSTNFTAVVLLQERQTSSTADSTTSNITSLLTEPNVDAILKFREINQLVNSSFCNIASLEVFRGWKEVFVVHHDGFSLTINGTIEINKDELSYSIEDYIGELYRMNISCSGGGLPQNGCLFFKVLGITYVKNAKFDCTVPGTLADFTEECNITTSGRLMTTSSTASDNPVTIIVSTIAPTKSYIKRVAIPIGIILLILLGTISTMIIILLFFYIQRKRMLHDQQHNNIHIDLQLVNKDASESNMECEENLSYGRLSQRAVLEATNQDEKLEHNYEDADEYLQTEQNYLIHYDINPAYSGSTTQVQDHKQKDKSAPVYCEIEGFADKQEEETTVG